MPELKNKHQIAEINIAKMKGVANQDLFKGNLIITAGYDYLFKKAIFE